MMLEDKIYNLSARGHRGEISPEEHDRLFDLVIAEEKSDRDSDPCPCPKMRAECVEAGKTPPCMTAGADRQGGDHD